MTPTTLSPRRIAAHVIGLVGPLSGLYLLWLIIPFFRGHITSPLVFAFNHFFALAAPWTTPLTASFDFASTDLVAAFGGWILYYFVGVAGFIAAAGLVMMTCESVSRILLVGWIQFRNEQREAAEAYRNAQRIEDARERRRERRLAAMQATKGKSGGCGGWLLLAAAVVFSGFL